MHVHVTLTMDHELLEDFDKWWKSNNFKNRSDTVSYLVKKELPEKRTSVPADADDGMPF